MSEAIYRDYDADALYAQYNNRAMTPADVIIQGHQADVGSNPAASSLRLRIGASDFDV